MTYQHTDHRLNLLLVAAVALLALAALLAVLPAASAQDGAPDTPGKPVGKAVFRGGVDLEWNEVAGAESYDVQLHRNGQWLGLPGDGVAIAFYGAGAIISQLHHEGSSYWFQVRAVNSDGHSDWSEYTNFGPTAEHADGRGDRPGNSPATGAPAVSGKAEAGATLAASVADIADGNGLDRVQFHYQWTSGEGSGESDIAGETGSTYTLQDADVGETIGVRVSFTDRGGYRESLASSPVQVEGEAQPANTPATGAPAISGTAQVGQTLRADTSGIADADGLSGVAFSYQWVSSDGTTGADLPDATGASYTLQAADAGKTVKVRVSFTDEAGNAETLTSAATDVVAAPPSVTVELSPSGSVDEGTAITVAMSFANLETDSDTATIGYVFRADVKDWENGDADACEGAGLGVDGSINQVDEDPEVRSGTISGGCPAGDYTVRASISSPEGVELASARAGFTVAAPAPKPTPEPTPSASPSVALALSPSGLAPWNTEISVTMSFGNLSEDSDRDTTDYVFRADVVDADACEGDGLGVDRYLYQVDEDPEVRTGTIAAGCPIGDYTVEVSVSDPDGVKLAAASADFSVIAPVVALAIAPPAAGAEGAVTITFGSLAPDAAAGLTYRADVVEADECEGEGLGVDLPIDLVDEDPEVRAGTISGGCPAGDYTVAAALYSAGPVQLAAASAAFTIDPPAPPPSAALALSAASVQKGSTLGVSVTFKHLPLDADSGTVDHIFRIDVVDHDECEGAGLGVDRTINEIDQTSGTYAGVVSAGCPGPGEHTVYAKLMSPEGVFLAGAGKSFTVKGPGSDDATLIGLAIDPGRLEFVRGQRMYRVGVASGVGAVRVTPTANAASAKIVVNGAAVGSGLSHEVALEGGAGADSSVIEVVVTAQDGVATESYHLHIDRGISAAYGWKAEDDFNGLRGAGNSHPTGIWSDGTTMWVVDERDHKIYAYDLATKARVPSKDIPGINEDNHNDSPGGLWSDGETIWVSDYFWGRGIFAYDLSTGSRQRSNDKGYSTWTGHPSGLWSDGETMWAADDTADEVKAFKLSSSGRGLIFSTDRNHPGHDTSDDFTTLKAAGNHDPSGIWSDGVTMWVADAWDDKIYAYRMSDKARDPEKDFNRIVGHRVLAQRYMPVHNMWSDGTTLWVVNNGVGQYEKIYAFNMPTSDNAELRSLSVQGEALIGPTALSPAFDSATTHYTATELVSDEQPVTVTVSAALRQHYASMQITPADADATTDGHQVALTRNVETTVTITVTSQDGTTTKTYTLALSVKAPKTHTVKLQFGLDDSDTETAGHQIELTEHIVTPFTITVTDSEGRTKTYTVNLTPEDLVAPGGG